MSAIGKGYAWRRASFLQLAILLAGFALLPTFAHAATLAEPNTSALSQGLVGYWPLDGETTNWKTGVTTDYSGQGNSGSLVLMATTTSIATGKIGQALKFSNVSNSYVNVPNSSSINLGAGDFTISLWEKENLAASGNNDDIFSKGFGSFNGGTAGVELRTRVNDTQLQFCVQASTICPRIAVSVSGAGTWRHIVMIVSRTNSLSSLYVNGVLVGTMAFAPAYTDTFPLMIGKGSDTNFPGLIDDFRIYNKALTQQQIALLYAAGNANVGHSNTNISSGIGLNKGLIGYWTMDGQDIGNSFIDRSGNGLNGYLVGTNNATSSRKTVGKIGEGFSFGGQNTGSINLGNSSILTPTRFTIAGWIYVTNPQAAYPYNYIFSSARDCCGTYNGINFAVNSAGGLYGGIWNSSQYSTNSANGTIATSTWTHVAYEYDGATMKLYKNGVQVASAAQTIDPGTPASFNTYIGSMGNGNGIVYTINGKIDDMRLYNRALSSTEIAQLAAQGNANIAHSNTATQTGLNSGLVGYWTFDGPNMNWKTGQALDSSGNGNNGNLFNLGTTTAPAIGKIGQALKFSPGYIYSSLTSTSFSSAYTVSMWASANCTTGGTYLSFFASNQNILLGCDGSGIFMQHALAWFYVANPGNNKMHHLTFVWNGTVGNIYIDGVIASKFGAVGTMVNPTGGTSLTIGSRASGGAILPGVIDDFRIYNRALSPQEIQQLYAIGR